VGHAKASAAAPKSVSGEPECFLGVPVKILVRGANEHEVPNLDWGCRESRMEASAGRGQALRPSSEAVPGRKRKEKWGGTWSHPDQRL